MHLALIAAALAVPLEIPAEEDPAAWQEAAAMAGLELGPAGEGPWVRIEADGAGWTLVVEDRSGALRRVQVEIADEPSEREELVFLASSLLTPLPRTEPHPSPPRPAPEPVPEPDPTPVVVVEPPAPQPPVGPQLEVWLRLSGGAAWDKGLGFEPVFTAGPRLVWGPALAGLDVELCPYLGLPAEASRHALAAHLRAGVQRPGTWTLSATAGLGAQAQLFLTGQALDGGLVPSTGLLLQASRGPLGLGLQTDLALRRVELQTDAGPIQSGRGRVLIAATWAIGDRFRGSSP